MNKPDLRRYPDEPGVYLFKDASGRILYVGKARRLRRRLASYFRKGDLPAKTRLMLERAESLDILRTGTEKEALLLEAGLIKKHRPRFNIVLRDDKEYLLFRVAAAHPYPRLEVVRRGKSGKRDRGARYFGPFSSGGAARETWRLIHRYFPLRRCRDTAFANRSRPCLYYDMGQCLAPCVLDVPQADYRALLDKVLLFLSGKTRELMDDLREEMRLASAEERFEDAARLRDQIRAVERTLERQSVVLSSPRDLDVIGVAATDAALALGIVFVRGGQLIDGRTFVWPGLTLEDTPELIAGFAAQYYLDRQGFGESIPPRIIVPWLPDEAADAKPPEAEASREAPAPDDEREEPASALRSLEAVLSDLRGSPVRLSRPRDKDEDNLLNIARANALEAAKKPGRPPLAESLAALFRTQRPIRRVEAVDVSHTGGRETRAGLVLFEDEKALKTGFRSYALDADLAAAGAEAGDDYAALAAFARRRAARGLGPAPSLPFPDLLLVDGGKGQLAAVARAFAEAGVVFGPGADAAFVLASIAKARDEEGRTDRRAGNVADRIFVPGRSNPLPFAPGSAELLYLQRIRDAAHDFSLGRHRRARAKASFAGELARVPGLGPELSRRLFEHFGSLAAMAEAGEAALAEVPGVGRKKAAAIAERLALLIQSES